MNSQDFQDWKRHPITQAIMSNLEARVAYLKDEIVTQAAYIDQRELAEKAGAIKATNDVLSIAFEEIKDGD